MIRLMLVAGNRTESVATQLNRSNVFSINNKYSSINRYYDDISNSIVKVDKLLYIFSSDMDFIKEDMQSLKQLLENNNFFYPESILFIALKNDVAKEAVDYFQAVMDLTGYFEYSIHTFDTNISIPEISDILIGATMSSDFANSYKNVYREEVQSKYDKIYDKKDTSNINIDAFGYSNIIDYGDQKTNSIKADSGVKQRDNEVRVLNKKKSIYFDKINPVTLLESSKTYVISGKNKTGVSTWASALASSALIDKRSVTVLDFTYNSDIEIIMKAESLNYLKKTLFDVLQELEYKEGFIELIVPNNDKESSVLLDFLQNIYNTINKIKSDVIVLAVDDNILMDVLNLLGMDIRSVFICSTSRKVDFVSLYSKLSLLVREFDVKVILNNRVELLGSEKFLTADACKKMIPTDVKLVDTINFKSLKDVGVNLSKSLLI